MKRYITFLIILFFSIPALFAQVAKDYAVMLTAEVHSSPPSISLHWPTESSASSIQIFKKLKSDNSWGSIYASPSPSDTIFTDDSVIIGESYEYKVQIVKAGFTAYGYINAGIEVADKAYEGDIILVIDSVWSDALSVEIDRLIDDLERESWDVRSIVASRSLSASQVHDLIFASYLEDIINTKAVFIIGHVTVPYSGGFSPFPPDGHTDHVSAWPADAYYGDMDGIWTDATVTNTSGSDSRNHNIPGDGKFDQEVLPSDIELSVGRIDFFNMPSFGIGELELLRKYLDKDHAYRTKVFSPVYRALIDDNFGAFGGEAFAASGWKAFAPLLGNEAVSELDYLSTLDSSSYLWSYGCGGGWFQGAGGIGSSSDLASDSIQTVFNMMFGSYFGDWDVSDNFLRAQIASGTCLSSCWSGRPHWYFHHMGLGEHLGYSCRLTQNNNGLYTTNIEPYRAHIALMGDPSLKMHILEPISWAVATLHGRNVQIQWTELSSPITGYEVFSRTALGEFQRIGFVPYGQNEYWDSCASGSRYYLIRPVNLTQTPSGSYFKLGMGFITNTIDAGAALSSSYSYLISGGQIQVQTMTHNGIENGYWWDFGDGSTSTDSLPQHIYTANGGYDIILIVYNECDSFFRAEHINIVAADLNDQTKQALQILPNPTSDFIQFSAMAQNGNLEIFNLFGQSQGYWENISFPFKINASNLPAGSYQVNIWNEQTRFVGRFIKY